MTIRPAKDLTISGGTVNAAASNMFGRGISTGNDLVIKGGTVNATANKDLGTGAYVIGKVTIDNGTVTAEGIFFGVASKKGFTVNGGTVEVTADQTAIMDSECVTINDGSVIASASSVSAIEGVTKGVINKTKGLGWTDKDGTEGETEIPVSKEGQKLTYKKVQFFPAPAPVVPDEPAVPAASSALTVTSEIGTITRVTVDGKAVDSKYYTVSGNSVVLSDEFMRGLSNGTHTIRLYDGATYATATWTVSGNDTPTITAPKTADPGVALYGLLAVSSTLGLAFVGKKRKDD